MAKYDCSFTLKISGQPDQDASCCCPDEACFLDCQDALLDAGKALLSFRRANLVDGAPQSAKGKKVTVKITVKRDGKDHMGPISVSLHDLPDAAVAELEKQFESFCGCGAMKKAKARKSL